MKIIGISGSSKSKESSTRFVLENALETVSDRGVETELIDLSEYSFDGCHDCGGCRKAVRCSQNDDFTEKLLPRLVDSDIGGIIFASPVYFGGVSSQMKAFFDRTLPLRRNCFVWENRVAGAITVGGARNGGQEFAALDVIRFAMIQGMIVVPDASPTSHFGGSVWSKQPDGLTENSADVIQAKNLGTRVAEVALSVESLRN